MSNCSKTRRLKNIRNKKGKQKKDEQSSQGTRSAFLWFLVAMAFSRAQLKMDAMEKKGYKNCITHCISFPRENCLPLREISFPIGNQMKIKS